GYIPRLMETAALADVIVYVASDERYNDEVPTQFLHLLMQSGKPVVVCLVKMHETQAPALVSHFHKEVASRLAVPHGGGIVSTLAIPFLSPAQLADPVRTAGRYRVPLLNQVAVLGSPPQAARRRSALGATRFLVHACEDLLGVARQDLEAMQRWQAVVSMG